MPIYEYRCPNCSHEFEELVGISEPPPECPACGGKEVTRLLSTPSFSLKGDGWYSDHYGLKGSQETGASTENSTDAKSSSGDEE